MISHVIANKAALDDRDLAGARWFPPHRGRPVAGVIVSFHDPTGEFTGRLTLDVPADLWHELWPGLP